MSEKKNKNYCGFLIRVTNIESRLTATYVRNAHDIFTSTTMIVIKAPAIIGSVRYRNGATLVRNIARRHSDEITPPKATL